MSVSRSAKGEALQPILQKRPWSLNIGESLISNVPRMSRAQPRKSCNRVPGARVWTHDLDRQFVQLVAGLGRFAPDAFAKSFEPAERFDDIVRKHGGIPNKTEREDTWDIVFNENGVE